MPYYVFRITQPTRLLKNLELQDTCETYKEAREIARNFRMRQEPGDQAEYKLIHAASQLEAEERLQEHREKPILMEWEK
ncbi:hypothetical protein VSS37_18395 [Candidatus Thiothrix sp. Deng01]|uniref:Uncharacterized protein n=1 Tax=Candidatus Thiothrix phosphatis TaxID=3112415 RepID=A0ABU6D2F5_9GAMM|nr:hypothetical protein [Candidatus Thiothrix sp. Deng01]MEB4592956.1 hypothetical protein [Candidatus Thiothrix sp. Deng01]